ncbi:MAG: CoB--CoM heterodisulfide reductase iron-sulfur subunit B family protein [Deltaproteobacteria bacterium]|nr:CoB--CoM heterodisulfide reductase iron-sulfur subunit B family protein [Deltaproteobacteria bacterium]
MKLAYYPGCTLKTKARNLEESALAGLRELGVEFIELDQWNCCGAVYSLATDDLIHQVAPLRNLIRVQQEECDAVFTLCSQCYNTLARANVRVNENAEDLKTLNTFMDEEPDYGGSVTVMHFLTLLRDVVGWDKLKSAVKKPLKGLKVAPTYGCSLIRPDPVAITPNNTPVIMAEFLEAVGAEPVQSPDSNTCCGSFQALGNPDAALETSGRILRSAQKAGAQALVLSCPMCDYNLGRRQPAIVEKYEEINEMPVYYFTQLLAVALGLEADVCRFDLNSPEKDGNTLTAAAV